jgi:outer membrane immunogenic protein
MARTFLTIAACVGALLAGTSAFAADISVPEYDWTGPYAGLQFGYGWGKDHIHDLNLAGTTTDYSAKFPISGIVGGVHVGYDKQINRIVFGAVADLEATDVHGDNPTWPFGTDSKVHIGLQGSLRGRVGFALDRTLIYGTGGLAFANIKSDFYDTGGRHDSHSAWKPGWTLGAGAEHVFADKWSVGLEYRYTQFSQNRTVTTTTDPGWQEFDKLRDHAIRISVSYRF